MKLHIGIDGSRIAKPYYTGTEHYSYQIINNMFRVAPHHRYTIYAPKESTIPLDFGQAEVEYKIIPFPKLWTQVRLSWEMLTTKDKPEVLFIPSHTIPLVHPKKTVNTVHDLGFKLFPEYYGLAERTYQNIGLWLATRAATRIIAVSHATKKDIVSFTKYPEKKIDVVHHGYDRELFKSANRGELAPTAMRKHQPYLYYIGRLEEKKNIPRLIRAFRIAKEKYAIAHKLILAGKPGQHGYENVKKEIDALPEAIRKDIIELGYVSNEDHAFWLRFADSLVFPSNFEGFGLPALESMASGVPVIASNSSSLPEIVGEAGILVNHTRAEAIAEAIYEIVTNQKTRNDLISKGLQQAKKFSWEKSATQTIGILEQASKND